MLMIRIFRSSVSCVKCKSCGKPALDRAMNMKRQKAPAIFQLGRRRLLEYNIAKRELLVHKILFDGFSSSDRGLCPFCVYSELPCKGWMTVSRSPGPSSIDESVKNVHEDVCMCMAVCCASLHAFVLVKGTCTRPTVDIWRRSRVPGPTTGSEEF